MKPFPLLRLHHLTIDNVFEFMDLPELIRLSICKEKLHVMIKTTKQVTTLGEMSEQLKKEIGSIEMFELIRLISGNRIRFNEFIQNNLMTLEVQVSNNLDIRLKSDKPINRRRSDKPTPWDFHVRDSSTQKRYKGPVVQFKFKDVVVPAAIRNKHQPYIFWKNKEEGFKKLIICFVRTLNFQINTVVIEGGSEGNRDYSNTMRSILNLINTCQPSVDKCYLNDREGRIGDEDYRFILNNMNISMHYHIELAQNRPFQLIRRFESFIFSVPSAHWLTIDTLLLTNCAYINLTESVVTDEQLNIYMLHWIEGRFPKLKHLEVEKPPLDQQFSNKPTILNGLPVIDPVVRFPRTYQLMFEKWFLVHDGVDLRNQNGIIGTVPYFYHRSDQLSEGIPEQSDRSNRTFHFFVWPDSNGVEAALSAFRRPGMN